MHIKKYLDWQQLMEQATAEVLASPWTKNPESIKIMSLFTSGFIPSIIGAVDDLTILEYRTQLSKIDAAQLDSSIGFFKAAGYNQPNPKIKQFQQDIMNNTSYSTFTNVEGDSDRFDDGVFGRATSKAIINYMIQSMSKVPQTITVSAMQNAYGTDGASTREVQAKKFKTGYNIETETGTQSID